MGTAKEHAVEREKFLTALESVKAGLSRTDIVEQSSCLILQDGRVTSFDGGVLCRCKSGLPEDFKGAVPGDKLIRSLTRMKTDEVRLEMQNGSLLVRGAINELASLRLEKEISLPVDKVEVPKKSDWRPLASDFLDALNIVRHVAGKNVTQFKYTCVHIHPKWLEARDSNQISRYEVDTPVDQPLLIRRDSLQHILPLGVKEIAVTGNWAHFRKGSLLFSCTRYLETYPDQTPHLNLTGTKTQLPKGLADAALAAQDYSSENADNDLVLIEMRPGKIKILGEGISGSYRRTFSKSKEVDYKGPAIKFLIAPALLNEIVKKYNTCEICLDKKLSPPAPRLKVTGDKWVYITAMGVVSEKDSKEED